MLTRLGQLHSVVKGKHKIKEHVWNAENISLEIVCRDRGVVMDRIVELLMEINFILFHS